MNNAFQYIKDNGGIDTEASYPYEAVDGQCRFNDQDIGATDAGYAKIKSGDEDALMQAVATIGPIAVAIDASQRSFQTYSDGVYYDAGCTQKINHGVLVVGYGTEDGQDYWLVKNSWGISWGENGYVKMARNHNNHCAIATYASYPTV